MMSSRPAIPNFEGHVRRVDLLLRAKYPYLETTIYRINASEFSIYVRNAGEDFENINSDFERSIRFLGTPVRLSDVVPVKYERAIMGIRDEDIPCSFEGLPFTKHQLRTHIECQHPGVLVSDISLNEKAGLAKVELVGKLPGATKNSVQQTLLSLGLPLGFLVTGGGAEVMKAELPNDGVFNIVSSASLRDWDPGFLERDERLWYDNVDDIYRGSFTKNQLYFYDSSKSSCVVDFSVFDNCNLRNHLLLYDVIYCSLPLQEEMSNFLRKQKLTREDILYLVERGRLKILNVQPERRLDRQLIKDIYSVDSEAVVSRRAIAALCAIDVVDMASSYIFSGHESDKTLWAILKGLSEQTNYPMTKIAAFIFWPKYALRNSFDSLNAAGPMGTARYGVNSLTVGTGPDNGPAELDLEFAVSAPLVHVAHALDATYFPYFSVDSKYTDFPYASRMGNLLNFYRYARRDSINEGLDILNTKENGNRTLELISLFEINDYVAITEFEKVVDRSTIRRGIKTLFSKLIKLGADDRRELIGRYNQMLDESLKQLAESRLWLDLGEDAAGICVPFIPTGKKLLSWLRDSAASKYQWIQTLRDYFEGLVLPKDRGRRDISLLSKINRVARLRRDYV